MSDLWLALAREAGIAASHLALGATALGKANFQQQAYYSQAFFALSVGLERTTKLALVVDYASEHSGQFPSNSILRHYGHDLRKLLDLTDKIAERRGFTNEKRLPHSVIHDGIIKLLSDFASNITRYYNLDFVTGLEKVELYDPIRAWFEQVTTPILNAHCKPRHRRRIEQYARYNNSHLSQYVLILHHLENGQSINSVYGSAFHAGLTDFAKPYTRVYVLQIARFLAALMSDLRYTEEMPEIPDFSDFFEVFNTSDDFFRKREDWSELVS